LTRILAQCPHLSSVLTSKFKPNKGQENR